MARPEILNVPPVEAVALFRGKGVHVGFDWRDTDAAQHTASFTVAKAMELDLLGDIRRAVDQAIAEGQTFEHFRDRLEPLLKARGWWGRQEMVDPETGEKRIVQLGSPHRLRTIFDTNIRTSYERGRWQRIQSTKADLPYLRYMAVLDERTRPDHLAWHGTVLPVDHPFWETHYPPNGWYCRCIVQQLAEGDLQRFGYQVSEGPPAGSERTRPWINKRTGERIQVPVGIDPGFAHNVGTVSPVQQARRRLEERLPEAGAAVAAALRHDLDAYLAVGRELRFAFVAGAGGDPGAPGFPGRLRARITDVLRETRDAGTVTPNIGRGADTAADNAATGRVRAAARLLPASWITRANQTPVRVVSNGEKYGGVYYRAHTSGRDVTVGARQIHLPQGQATVVVSADPGNAMHEYTHHLQAAMPELDGLFQELHRRRTHGEPVIELPWYTGFRGRKDQYIDAYFGSEHGGSAREVITRAYQIVFHPLYGKETLGRLVREDPEMLDLALAALFRYNPDP